jgi:predicted choloylglycine hydrolase
MDPTAYCINGVRILRLSGTDVERAIQHGEAIGKLTKRERKTLATNPLSTKNQSLLKRAIQSSTLLPAFAKNTVSQTAIAAYEKTILTHHRNLDDRYTSRIEAFARHSNLSPRELIFALYQPDFLMVLAALTSEKVKPLFLSGMPGCSSAIVRTGKDHSLTLLRNLDYPAAGHWERWPTVFFHEPAETRFQNYVSVGSLGIHLAGLTGVNESGVAFSLHAHFSKKFSLKGAPIFFLGQELLENARSIDEAIFICKNFRTIGSWAINLASEKENRAVTIELSDGKTFTREMSPDDPAHAHSNGFQCTEFKKQELHFSGSFFEDVESRKASLEKNLTVANADEMITMNEALSSLASHEDFETGEQRIFGNSVSVVTTIQSVAFDLKNQEILLSAREETPTPLGPYLTIPTDWKKMATAMAHPIMTSLEHPFSSNFMDALHCYYLAYCSWHVMNESPAQVLEHLIHATEFLDHDPHLLMQRGYFELLIGRTAGHYQAALGCFERALTDKMSLHHQQVARYFRGVCLDLLGHHHEALDEYTQLADATDIDPKLKKKANKRLKNPFESVYCQKIVPDLQFVEPLEYA